MENHEERIRSLEDWRNTVDTAKAVDELRRAHMDERFDRVDDDLKAIKSAFNKVIWIVLSLVLTAVVGFLLEGGLIVGT